MHAGLKTLTLKHSKTPHMQWMDDGPCQGLMAMKFEFASQNLGLQHSGHRPCHAATITYCPFLSASRTTSHQNCAALLSHCRSARTSQAPWAGTRWTGHRTAPRPTGQAPSWDGQLKAWRPPGAWCRGGRCTGAWPLAPRPRCHLPYAPPASSTPSELPQLALTGAALGRPLWVSAHSLMHNGRHWRQGLHSLQNQAERSCTSRQM